MLGEREYPKSPQSDTSLARCSSHAIRLRLDHFIEKLEKRRRRISCSLSQRKMLEEIFRKFDTSRDGLLSQDEISDALRESDSLSEIEIGKLREAASAYDRDGDGNVDINEFLDSALEIRSSCWIRYQTFFQVVFLVAWLLLPPAVFCSFDDWQFVDALYFAVVTISTVGYGDLGPGTDNLKIFTSVYIFCSIAVVAVILMELINTAIEAQYRQVKSLLARPMERSSRAKTNHRRQALFDFSRRLIVVACLVLVPMICGSLFAYFWDKHTLVDSIYWSIVTVTTVGYGDVAVGAGDAERETKSRIFALCFILVTVPCFGTAWGRFSDAVLQLRSDNFRQHQLSRQLSPELLADLDMDGDGVDKAEFLCAMLLLFDQVDKQDLLQILYRFDSLDRDGNGRLTAEDLSHLRPHTPLRAHLEMKKASAALENHLTNMGRDAQSTTTQAVSAGAPLETIGDATQEDGNPALIQHTKPQILSEGTALENDLTSMGPNSDDAQSKTTQAILAGAPLVTIRDAKWDDWQSMSIQLRQDNTEMTQKVAAVSEQLVRALNQNLEAERSLQQLTAHRQALRDEVRLVRYQLSQLQSEHTRKVADMQTRLREEVQRRQHVEHLYQDLQVSFRATGQQDSEMKIVTRAISSKDSMEPMSVQVGPKQSSNEISSKDVMEPMKIQVAPDQSSSQVAGSPSSLTNPCRKNAEAAGQCRQDAGHITARASEMVSVSDVQFSEGPVQEQMPHGFPFNLASESPRVSNARRHQHLRTSQQNSQQLQRDIGYHSAQQERCDLERMSMAREIGVDGMMVFGCTHSSCEQRHRAGTGFAATQQSRHDTDLPSVDSENVSIAREQLSKLASKIVEARSGQNNVANRFQGSLRAHTLPVVSADFYGSSSIPPSTAGSQSEHLSNSGPYIHGLCQDQAPLAETMYVASAP